MFTTVWWAEHDPKGCHKNSDPETKEKQRFKPEPVLRNVHKQQPQWSEIYLLPCEEVKTSETQSPRAQTRRDLGPRNLRSRELRPWQLKVVL